MCGPAGPSDEETDDGRRLFRLLGNALFDRAAVELINRYGFADPAEVVPLVRTLDQVPSLVQARSTTRNLLANLLAVVLAEVARAAEPARVINRLERIVTRTGAPGALYRTLLDAPPLRTQLVALLDSGDLVTDRLSKYPEVFDFLVASAPDIETRAVARVSAVGETARPGRGGVCGNATSRAPGMCVASSSRGFRDWKGKG